MDSQNDNSPISDLERTKCPSNPGGSSFISNPEIENPQLELPIRLDEEVTLSGESSSIDPAKPESIISLLPKVEPYYKRFYSDTDSESSIKHIEFECEFFVRYETSFGQSIFIVGSSEELGAWDLFKGVQMKWGPDHLWTAKVLIRNLPAEYKYVCFSDQESVWERGKNRKILKKTEEFFDYWQEF
jgi:hypothetical protein